MARDEAVRLDWGIDAIAEVMARTAETENDVPILADEHERDPERTAAALESFNPLGSYDHNPDDVQPVTGVPDAYDSTVDAPERGADELER